MPLYSKMCVHVVEYILGVASHQTEKITTKVAFVWPTFRYDNRYADFNTYMMINIWNKAMFILTGIVDQGEKEKHSWCQNPENKKNNYKISYCDVQH